MEFSVIVPIYNAEKTIERCLNSVMSQTFRDFEVLLINDGSTDNSLEKCISISKNDKRISIISQKNSGPSFARNKGLDIAKGKRIVFVDSDDYLENNCLQIIHEKFLEDDYDAVFISFNVICGQLKTKKIYKNFNSLSLQDLMVSLSNRNMFGYTWCKVFNKNIVGTIRFDKNLYLMEDELFTIKVISKCKNIGIINEPIYNYIIGNSNALTQKTYPDYCIIRNKIYKEWKSYINSNELIYEMSKSNFVTTYYYLLEKNIRIRPFIKMLKSTEYFNDYKKKNYDNICKYIDKEKVTKLKIIRWKYRLKNTIFRYMQYLRR